MIDWNGNGVIDPLDVGLTMAMLDEDEFEEEQEEKPEDGETGDE